jgi:PIN domain nuclease of toxin-antitoxin system
VLLLDTNVVYRWLMAAPLPDALIERVGKEGAAVSIVSPWEMTIKHQIGKLDLPTADVAGDITAQGFQLLPIRPEHLAALRGLPLLHRDPFDRMLLAQARSEGMIVATTDRIFKQYLPNAWVV